MNFHWKYFCSKISRIDETEAETKDRLNNWEEFLEKAEDVAEPATEKSEAEQSTTATETQ